MGAAPMVSPELTLGRALPFGVLQQVGIALVRFGPDPIGPAHQRYQLRGLIVALDDLCCQLLHHLMFLAVPLIHCVIPGATAEVPCNRPEGFELLCRWTLGGSRRRGPGKAAKRSGRL